MRSSISRTYPDAIRPRAGVLIKHQPLAQASRAENLLDQAKRRARELAKSALSEAQACQRLGMGLGYQEGFALVIKQLIRHLLDCRQLHAHVYRRQIETLEDALRNLLAEPALLLRIADELADRQEQFDQAPIKVLIPQTARHIAPDLRRRLGRAGQGVEVAYTDTATFIVTWGEEIIEFDPHDAAFQLVGEAHLASEPDALAIDADALQRQALARTLQHLEDHSTKGEPNHATGH